MKKIGAVVIGRNEGKHLAACLQSLRGADKIIYVDSGSTDNSRDIARAFQVDVVELDMSVPFTAARARNAGASALARHGSFEFVQFIDGDCELSGTWLETASIVLHDNSDLAIVCGRRRERFPQASWYNEHCDREWDTPIGEAKACGGDFLIRRENFDAVGGFDETLIAGEEPELCVRLRNSGLKVLRIDAEMTLHDANITRFGQFWTRAKRAGFAYALGADKHGAPPERHFVPETWRALFWGVAIPVIIVFCAAFVSNTLLLGALIFPAQILRLWRRDGWSAQGGRNALLLTVSKFPEALGVLSFYLGKIRNKQAHLIEYK